MRYVSWFLALMFIGGLLISTQAMAAGQHQSGAAMSSTLTGEQLRQWHQAQQRVVTQEFPPYQERVHAAQLNQVQICEMQRLLNQRGYSIRAGETAMIGQTTMAAIYNFQRDQGLTVTGMPNDETLNALSQSSGHDEFFGLAPAFGEPVD